MTPVMQTYLVNDGSGIPGNCLQAAVASILDKPLELVPHFILFKNWFEAVRAYIDGIGCQIHIFSKDPGVECIAIGLSPRQVRHAVIWDGGLVHDPHPSRAGFVEDPDEFWVLKGKEKES